MITIQAAAASPGFAEGILFCYSRKEIKVVEETELDAEDEVLRFNNAKEKIVTKYNDLYGQTLKISGEENAMIFQIHAMMLEDDDFSGFAVDLIRSKKVSAEYAVKAAQSRLEQMLKDSGEELIAERGTDVREIVTAMLEELSGYSKSNLPETPYILFTEELTPAETVSMDKTKLLAIVTQKGSYNSHSSIIARSMGIPAVCSLNNFDIKRFNGTRIIVDGFSGNVICGPDEKTIKEYQKKQEEKNKKQKELSALIGKENKTRSGQSINIFANAGNQSEVQDVLKNDAGGIGLLRSEFLYLSCSSYPDEEVLFSSYRSIAAQMSGKPVIIRTIDIGADKKIGYFNLPAEENPALGFRAIRICLSRPELFKTQLRAILRASAFGLIQIMFPMIISVSELRDAKKLLEDAKQELREKRIAFDESIKVGIMIETPAAAIMSDELAKECDFFSIGTNDLTQYTLAIDRQNQSLAEFLDSHHPAILRLIELTVKNAHAAKIKVGICGQLGSDFSLTEEFLKMGIDELSVTPNCVLPLRQKIRSLN